MIAQRCSCCNVSLPPVPFYIFLEYFFQHPTDRMGNVRSYPGFYDLHQGTSDHRSSTRFIISLQVHAMFGRTLILAGLTRIIEVCYFVPSYTAVQDYASENTLADGGSKNLKYAAARSWGHLTPFVSVSSHVVITCSEPFSCTFFCSYSSLLGESHCQ